MSVVQGNNCLTASNKTKLKWGVNMSKYAKFYPSHNLKSWIYNFMAYRNWIEHWNNIDFNIFFMTPTLP